MKNFLSKHYEHYYIQTADGQHLETTRSECFAPGETPTAENPYKQRWFYDIEAGYVVRLLRNAEGEALFKANEVIVRKEERHQERKYACVRKGKDGCKADCETCQSRVARTVELDKPLADDADDEDAQYLEIAALDVFAELEDAEERVEETTRLHKAISSLPEKRQKVCRLYFFDGYTAEEIGAKLGISRQAVNQQIATIKKDIKNFF